MSGFTPEIQGVTNYIYFPELEGVWVMRDGVWRCKMYETGRWHMFKSTPIVPVEGRAARYDPQKSDEIYQDIDEADKAYRRLQREALQVMVDQVDLNG